MKLIKLLRKTVPKTVKQIEVESQSRLLDYIEDVATIIKKQK